MRKRTFFLVIVILLLFILLALELKYIEDSLTLATTTTEENCNNICAEEGKTGLISDGFCNCRSPVSFSKRWTCFWNITSDEEKSISYSDSFKKPSKSIPVYPSDMFKEKIEPVHVRNLAVSTVSAYPSPNDAVTKIFGIYKLVSDRISYVSDPVGEEYIAWPNETLETSGGDCDDYTVLLASMYKSVGVKSTIVQVHNHDYGHVFLIVPIGETLSSFLEKYKAILERHSDLYGELPFNFIIFGTDKKHCEGINRNLEEGGDINSFNLIIDGTSRDYPGSTNPVEGFEFIKFIPL